ncbi:hypothetical protein [Burkholderia cenocepacia]
MFATLEAKALAVGVLAAVLVVASGALYAGYEHLQAQKAQIVQLQSQVKQEQANTAVALAAASAVSAALDAQAAAKGTAQARTTASTRALAQAVAASPAVASQVVPESYWQAVYGSADNDNK